MRPMSEAPPDTGVKIRLARPSDAESLARVHVTAMRVAYRHLMPADFLDSADRIDNETAEFVDRMSEPESNVRVWLAESRAETCGYVVTGPSFETDGAPDWAALYAPVTPAFWKRGVGRATEAASSDLTERGFHHAVLYVYRDNLEARAFDDRLGWRADGKEFSSGQPFHLDTLRYKVSLECSPYKQESSDD